MFKNKLIQCFCFFYLVLLQSCSTAAPVLAPKQEGMPVTSRQLTQLPNEVEETSGLSYHNQKIWTHNDSGDEAVVYALDARSYKLLKKVNIAGAKNVDWEDMAQDETYLYIADTGNNSAERSKKFEIYRVRWDLLEAAQNNETVPSQVLQFSYGEKDGSLSDNADKIDCEAVTIVGDELWLFSKDWDDDKTVLYRMNKKLKYQILMPQATYSAAGLISGADYNSKTKQMALIGYQANAFGPSFVWIANANGSGLDWDSAKYHQLTPHAQWEAVLWSGNKRLFISAENSRIGNEILADVKLNE